MRRRKTAKSKSPFDAETWMMFHALQKRELCRQLEDGTRVQIMHNGLRVLADGYYGDWNTRLIELCHGCHEPQEGRVFHQVMQRLSAKATMIELGGYWLSTVFGFYQADKNAKVSWSSRTRST